MRFFAAVLAAVVLHGCALAPSSGSLPQLASVPAAFEMSARVSIRQFDRSDIAKLRWTHRARADTWIISSPLGNDVARIESNGDGATLVQAGGSPRHAQSFAALTEEVLGVPLDPPTLAAWLHGDIHDTPANWRVTIDERQETGDVKLARRLTAARGGVAVRLVVDDYKPLAE
jgi:outer membrane biogenesis lipoprotein LolB